MYSGVPFVAALVATTAAVQCISPPPPGTVDLSEDWDVEWSHVDTDSSQLCVYLSNFQLAPNPHTIFVAGPVNTNSDGTTVAGSCDLPIVDSPYRVRLSECGNPNTIYSECNQVDVSQDSCDNN
ncbi:uncharacterized protein APUU_10096A [Aspergillus puulaauensis]|uniref:Uncharacterized protein n=1 Tax=Aspergillus puulaauensis TaxID=1220207 RepID=A0A7R7XA40_9EURO|nr:uncharacterized protein APUU_10096A [Aspergillus puulaauensis]BCS17268.1 hypothetical protein APUU_10096A [Aspergillus puulaauensis]